VTRSIAALRWLIVIMAAAAAGDCGQPQQAHQGSGSQQTDPEALPPEWRDQHDSDYLQTRRDSTRSESSQRAMEAESINAVRGGPQPDRSVGEFGD
jgi:hypothetical protein